MKDKEVEPPRIARDLADGFSTQAKHSNSVWLALIAAATLVLFPNVNHEKIVTLPFSLGLVDFATYKVVGFFILTVLMISYCQTYAAAHVASQFAHETISKIEPYSKRIQARNFFDLFVSSTLSRVGPLARLTGHSRLAAIYYFLLKSVAVLVIFAIPSTALIVAYCELAKSSSVARWMFVLASFALLITSIGVLQIVYIEYRHARRVSALYWRGDILS